MQAHVCARAALCACADLPLSEQLVAALTQASSGAAAMAPHVSAAVTLERDRLRTTCARLRRERDAASADTATLRDELSTLRARLLGPHGELARLQRQARAAQQQLRYSEQRVRAKEGLVEKLQAKLEQEVTRQRAARQRDGRIFRAIKQRVPNGGDTATCVPPLCRCRCHSCLPHCRLSCECSCGRC